MCTDTIQFTINIKLVQLNEIWFKETCTKLGHLNNCVCIRFLVSSALPRSITLKGIQFQKGLKFTDTVFFLLRHF